MAKRLPPLVSATTFIYALTEPTDGTVRYVGKANDPARRYKAHCRGAERDTAYNYHKNQWIRSLLRVGLRPSILLIEECERVAWKARECFWIAKYREAGCDLTNAKDGGDGYDPCELTRLKMSAAKLGKPPHNKGKQTSEEAKAKQRHSAALRWSRPGERERAAAAQLGIPKAGRPKGIPQSQEARARISASLIGNIRTRGLTFSAAIRARMSAAQVVRWSKIDTRRRREIGLRISAAKMGAA